MKRVVTALVSAAVAAGALTACAPKNPSQLPIDHIVVLMQENRSADYYLGQLHSQGQPDYEAEPTTGNPDPLNPMHPPILPFHKTTYCDSSDLNHSWNGVHQEVNGGAMDGFTAANDSASANADPADPTGARSMGYYDQTDLPFYYSLYNTFATNDRYFSSVLTQTFPNRLYLLAGTSFGHIRNDASVFGSTQKSIFELMDEGFVGWKIYAATSTRRSLRLAVLQVRGGPAANHVFPMSQYYADAAAGNLPNVSFVDPEAPRHRPASRTTSTRPSNVQVGQKFVADVINALMASPNWGTSAMFLTYDEHGGFYDHVRPACGAATGQHSADAATRGHGRAHSTTTASACPWW